MKYILSFILFFSVFQIYSQNIPDILIRKAYSGSLDLVLDKLGEDYGLKISYPKSLLAPIKYSSSNQPLSLSDLLNKICLQNDLKIDIADDQTIYLINKKAFKNGVLGLGIHYIGNPTKHKFKLSGKVTDYYTGESLPFVNIVVCGTSLGTTSNVDGFFSLLEIPSDTVTLIVSYVGYKSQNIYLTPINTNRFFEIKLIPEPQELGEVLVSDEKINLFKPNDLIGLAKISPSKLNTLPNLGEKDVFRSFQLLPGVSASSEMSSGLSVRGGTPDQTLVLFDWFTVYNVDHLFGYFSAFNANSIKDVQLFKGGFDAKYGGRLSSVVDITGKEGNKNEFNTGIDLSMMSSNVLIESPIGTKGSILITGRRSWESPIYTKVFDKLSKSSSDITKKLNGGKSLSSYFYDVNTKLTYALSNTNLISISLYSGADRMDNSISQVNQTKNGSNNYFTSDVTQWGNMGASFKWARKWSDKFYINWLFSYSDYYGSRDRTVDRSMLDNNGNTRNVKLGLLEGNNIKDYSFKSFYEYQLLDNNQLGFGLNTTHYLANYNLSQSDTVHVIDQTTAGVTYSAFAHDKLQLIGNRLTIIAGSRLTYYDVTKKTYFEPRLNASFQITPIFKLKASFGEYFQFTNRVIREDILQGSRDFWVLADNNKLPVSTSEQWLGGFSLENSDYLFDAEIYSKILGGIAEYSMQVIPKSGKLGYTENFLSGDGIARGIDLMLQKKQGRYTGWIAYSIGHAVSHFDAYGSGYFFASNDVPKELKIVNFFKLKNWDFSATWIYASGRPYTSPEGGYEVLMIDGSSKGFVSVSAKNGNRYSDYHRLDIAATYNFRLFHRNPCSISMSIFNLYNRKNIWYKDYHVEGNKIVVNDVNYLGLTPNISFSIRLK